LASSRYAGRDYSDRLKDAGIPFIVVLDKDGKQLANSIGTNGENIGFPYTPAEAQQFINIIRKTATNLNESQLEKIADALIIAE